MLAFFFRLWYGLEGGRWSAGHPETEEHSGECGLWGVYGCVRVRVCGAFVNHAITDDEESGQKQGDGEHR